MKFTALIIPLALLLFGCQSGTQQKVSENGEQMQTVKADSARLVTVEIAVGGMTCTGCEQTITGGVTTLPGVTAAVASWKDSVARVTFDTLLVTREAIDSVIVAKGYQVLASGH